MNHGKMLVLAGSLAAFLLLSISQSASAQDAAVVNSKTVRVKLENSHVRVLESTLQPGDKEQLHSHPASVIYILSGGKARNHNADGKVTESEFTAGETVYREPLTHWAENIGTTTIHLIIVEIKDSASKPAGQ